MLGTLMWSDIGGETLRVKVYESGADLLGHGYINDYVGT